MLQQALQNPKTYSNSLKTHLYRDKIHIMEQDHKMPDSIL